MDVLGVQVSLVNIPLACEKIEEWIAERKRSYVCVAPVAVVMDCQDDPEYRMIVNSADMVTPDGMPLVWLGRLRGHQEIARTYGPDLMLALCERGQAKDYKHYLYGATPDTCQRLEETLKKKFPRLNILGKFSPPYERKFAFESDERIGEINRLNPDILWVALGSPKQDYWIHHHRGRLNAPVMMAVGAAFDFLSGVKRQAPRWMQRCGLEWAFRLSCEPRRLWRRYLLGNSRFVYLLGREFVRGKLMA